MRYDIWKFTAIVLIAGLLGYQFDAFFVGLAVGAIGIIGWQMYRFDILLKWIYQPNTTVMPDTSGQFYLLHREMSRQKFKAAQRKRQINSLLRQFGRAMSALPDAYVLVDDFGKIGWANARALQLLGIRWPQDAGVRFTDLIRHSKVDNLLEQHSPELVGIDINPVTNSDQTINIKCVRYTNTMRMIVARDISRLVKVNEMHSDFVANVSHELKTPLTVLIGYIEILQDNDQLAPQLRKPMAQMQVQSTRMQLIVNDLLYLAQLEDMDNARPHTPVEMTALINTIVHVLQPLIDDKQQQLKLEVDHDLTIMGCHAELHSAFSNLLTNAITYTPEQGLIRVRWHSELRNGVDTAIFSVHDNGGGIAAEHLDRLTQRFYRVDNNRSRDSGGTGLGLAIVKHVLQRHNAELIINSTEGVGSEFICVIPINADMMLPSLSKTLDLD